MEGVRTEPAFYGWMAEFEDAEALVAAAEAASQAGYTQVEAYSPMPVHGLSEALRLKRTWMPQIVLAGGLTGLLGGFGLLYWITVLTYPLNVGGRPYFSWPAYIPIMFETTVLLGAISGVAGLLALCGLPRPYHAVFNVPEFQRASRDKFFLAIEVTDPKFDKETTREFLESLEPAGVHYVED